MSIEKLTTVFELPTGMIVGFPDDIIALWKQAYDDEITWEYFTEQVEEAAREGRIYMLKEVG